MLVWPSERIEDSAQMRHGRAPWRAADFGCTFGTARTPVNRRGDSRRTRSSAGTLSQAAGAHRPAALGGEDHSPAFAAPKADCAVAAAGTTKPSESNSALNTQACGGARAAIGEQGEVAGDHSRASMVIGAADRPSGYRELPDRPGRLDHAQIERSGNVPSIAVGPPPSPARMRPPKKFSGRDAQHEIGIGSGRLVPPRP